MALQAEVVQVVPLAVRDERGMEGMEEIGCIGCIGEIKVWRISYFNYELRITNYELSPISPHLPVTLYLAGQTHYELRTTNYELRTHVERSEIPQSRSDAKLNYEHATSFTD